MAYNFASAFAPPYVPSFDGPIVGLPKFSAALGLEVLRRMWIDEFLIAAGNPQGKSKDESLEWVDQFMPRICSDFRESFFTGENIKLGVRWKYLQIA